LTCSLSEADAPMDFVELKINEMKNGNEKAPK
jgi:hypothetical protein